MRSYRFFVAPIGNTSHGRLLFGVRFAEYKYYDMAPIIEKALNMEI